MQQLSSQAQPIDGSRGWQIKLRDPSTTRVIPQRFCDEVWFIRRRRYQVSRPLTLQWTSAQLASISRCASADHGGWERTVFAQHRRTITTSKMQIYSLNSCSMIPSVLSVCIDDGVVITGGITRFSSPVRINSTRTEAWASNTRI